MTTPAAPVPASRLQRALSATGLAILLVAVALATALAAVFGGPAAAAVPVVLVCLGYLITRMPLRVPTAVLLGMALTFDRHEEDWGQWHTPLAVLGDLLHAKLPGTSAFSGIEVLALFLVGIGIHRLGTLAAEERRPLQLLPVVRDGMLLYLGGVLMAEANGIAHGLGPALFKLRNLLQPLLYFLLFSLAFRVPRDYRLLGRVVVFAATFRAVLSIVVQRLAIAEYGGRWATATSHGDSILFAVAMFLLLVELMERPNRRRKLRALLLLPVVLAGEEENGRRLFWVMLLLMLFLAYGVSPLRGWKRAVTRFAVVTGPLLLLYAAAGWNSSSAIFRPIRTLRSVSDTSVDHSAYWREVENWNMAVQIREHPLIGIGLGGEYTETKKNDDLSSIFPDYRAWPHNSILGMLLLMGVVGFSAVWTLFAMMMFLALRAHHLTTDPEHRVGALVAAGALVACHVMAYGDTGVAFPQTKIFLGLGMAVASMAAAATGAWDRRPRRIGPASPSVPPEGVRGLG